MKSILVLSAALLVLTGAPRTAAAQDTTQTARFVPDVVAQFNALTQRADAMGFELYGPDPSQCRHMQSIVRVDAADGTPYFLVSRSTQEPGVNPFCEGGSKQSNIYIVRMGSRDKSGERLRSNRLRRFMETTDTPPDPEDKVVATILFDGSSEWPHFDHPGAMQRLGNVVAIALEAGQSGQPTTKILFFDVTDPEHPAMLNNSFDPPTQKAGVVGITPCATGREGLPCATGHFLMLVSGGDNDELLFFESNGGDLTSPDLQWAPLYTWHKNELVGGDWPAKHQTLHFIREANAGGRLFLAGARAVGTVEGLYGDDYIDLFEVGFDGSRVVLTQQSTRHMISHPGGEGLYRDGEVLYGGRLASFAAASGFHVTPTGELLFYATEHDNDGPQGTNGRATVKMGEWRHIDMFRPDSPALAPTITAPTSIAVDEGQHHEYHGHGRPADRQAMDRAVRVHWLSGPLRDHRSTRSVQGQLRRFRRARPGDPAGLLHSIQRSRGIVALVCTRYLHDPCKRRPVRRDGISGFANAHAGRHGQRDRRRRPAQRPQQCRQRRHVPHRIVGSVDVVRQLLLCEHDATMGSGLRRNHGNRVEQRGRIRHAARRPIDPRTEGAGSAPDRWSPGDDRSFRSPSGT